MPFFIGSAILGFKNAPYWMVFALAMIAWGTWAWKMRLPSKLAVQYDPSLKLGFWGMIYHHMTWIASFVGMNSVIYLIVKIIVNGWN
jgi:hypothetical protein